MAWHKQELEPHRIREISRKLELDPLLVSIFERRGCTEELLFFLEKSARYLHNPFLLNEMYDAAERTLGAIDEKEVVLIFGDRDVDGVCSTAILYHGLLELGIANLQFRNPSADDEYGLSAAAVEEAAQQGITLIITADCGCANHNEIALAHEHGIDVIVLDHHTPKEERPLAYALVNPHGPDLNEPPYPFVNISAATVSGKFLWAVGCLKEERRKEMTDLCLLDIIQITEETENKKQTRIFVQAAKLQHQCVQSRFQLEIKHPEDAQKLTEYIQNEVLCSFTASSTHAAMAAIYGPNCEIYLHDLCAELLPQSPSLEQRLHQSGALQNNGLLRSEIQKQSRLARYRELDAFECQLALLISMLDQRLALPKKLLHQSLDLMALACIADMMPLQNENRIIVALGLKSIADQPREGLRELLLELGLLGRKLSAKELSWKLIPVLNAAGRMGHTGLVTRLLTEADPDQRQTLARRLIEVNQQRREQSEKFLSLAQEPARKSWEASKERLIYVAIPQLSRGITGLIAGRLSQQYGGRPCMVLSQNQNAEPDSGQGEWSGSMRSSSEPSVLELLNPLADYFLNYGGHQAAGGFSLTAERQKQLWPALLALLDKLPKPEESEESAEQTKIDAEIPVQMLNPALIERIWTPLAPYGMEWPELVLFTQGLYLQDVRPIGQNPQNGHLRLNLRAEPTTKNNSDNGGKDLHAVFWRSAQRYPKDFTKGDMVDILYHIQTNRYQGQVRFQLELIDIRRHCQK